MKFYVQNMFLIVVLILAATTAYAIMLPGHAQENKHAQSTNLTEIAKQNDVLKRQTNIIKELYTRVMKLEEKIKRLEDRIGYSDEQ